MAEKLEYYRTLANRMIENDKDRNKAFQGYEDIYHCDARFPKALENLPWFRKVISTDPHDAIEGGTRIMTNVTPRVTVLPLAEDPANREKANEREKVLLWHLKNANRRRSSKVESDVMRSALLYSAVCANVIDLDWQAKAMGWDGKRWKAMRRMGRFQINTFNAKDVHVQRSGQMVERVLLIKRMPAQEVYDTYHTKELRELAEQGLPVVFFDYWDLDIHATWCTPEDNLGELNGDDIVILAPVEHDLPFLPWIALMGGSTLEEQEEHKYHPLLYTVHRTGDWNTQNVVKSLYVSEVIRLSGSPRWVEQGIGEEPTIVDAGGEATVIKVSPTNTLTPAPPPQIDRALVEVDERMAEKTERSTVSRSLLSGAAPSGIAFETYNTMIQSALGALHPAKSLSEQAMAEIFTLMMLWAEYTKNDLTAYSTDKRNAAGKRFEILADEIDPESIYIEVELNTDEPTDRQQRANTATQIIQWGYPKLYALEDMGITDPQSAYKMWWFEKLQEHELNLLMQKDVMMMQTGIQQQAQMQAQAMQMQMQQAMMQQQQPQGPPPQEGPVPGGEGFNPAMGGQSPVTVNPTETYRENVTGQTRGGNPIAGGMP